MKIVKNKVLPPSGYSAITLWPFVFTHDDMDEETINHELIHGEQEKEMLFIPFLLWYGIEYIVRRFQYGRHNKAYRNISFERESYANENNLEYLKNRKHFSWLKYLKK